MMLLHTDLCVRLTVIVWAHTNQSYRDIALTAVAEEMLQWKKVWRQNSEAEEILPLNIYLTTIYIISLDRTTCSSKWFVMVLVVHLFKGDFAGLSGLSRPIVLLLYVSNNAFNLKTLSYSVIVNSYVFVSGKLSQLQLKALNELVISTWSTSWCTFEKKYVATCLEDSTAYWAQTSLFFF